MSGAPDHSGFDRPLRGALRAFFAACDGTMDRVDPELAQRIGKRALRDPSAIGQIVDDEMRPVVKVLVARLRALGKDTKKFERRCQQEIPVLVARLHIPLRMRCLQEIEQAAMATALQEITKRAGQRVPSNKDEVKKILEVEASKAFQVVVDRMRVLGLGNVDAEETRRRRFAADLSERLRGLGLL